MKDLEFTMWLLGKFATVAELAGQVCQLIILTALVEAADSIVQIESKHASTRRCIALKSVQTHARSLEDVSSDWVIQQSKARSDDAWFAPPTRYGRQGHYRKKSDKGHGSDATSAMAGQTEATEATAAMRRGPYRKLNPRDKRGWRKCNMKRNKRNYTMRQQVKVTQRKKKMGGGGGPFNLFCHEQLRGKKFTADLVREVTARYWRLPPEEFARLQRIGKLGTEVCRKLQLHPGKRLRNAFSAFGPNRTSVNRDTPPTDTSGTAIVLHGKGLAEELANIQRKSRHEAMQEWKEEKVMHEDFGTLY